MTQEQRNQLMIENAMINISGDYYEKIYNLPNCNNFVYVTELIKQWAREFVKQLDWKGDDEEERDWMIELNNFCGKKFYDISKKTFAVDVTMTISKRYFVEATTEEEAEKIMLERTDDDTIKHVTNCDAVLGWRINDVKEL